MRCLERSKGVRKKLLRPEEEPGVKYFVCLWMVVFISGCACSLSPAERAGEEWVADHLVDDGGSALTDIAFYEVDELHRDAARAELSTRPLVGIGSEQAAAYTGGNLSLPDHKQFYLVRAVYGYLGSGGYDVRSNGSLLVVHHSSLGSCMLYNKSALVVALDKEPAQVVVYVSVAR